MLVPSSAYTMLSCPTSAWWEPVKPLPCVRFCQPLLQLGHFWTQYIFTMIKYRRHIGIYQISKCLPISQELLLLGLKINEVHV
jgi:hypothetical protein